LKLEPKWRLGLAVGFGLLYYTVARVILPANGPETISNIIWPSAGIGLAAFLLIGNWAVLPVAIPAFLLSGHLHTSAPAALATALGSAGEGALGAFLLRRVLEPGLLLRRLRGVVAFFFLGATLSTLVAATGCEVIHTLLGLHQWHELPTRVFQWGEADLIGILIVTPLILSWSKNLEWAMDWRRVVEAALLFTGLAVVCFSAFMSWGGLVNWKPIYDYYIVPFLLWATIRLGQRAAFTASAVVAIFAVWGALLPGTWLTPTWVWGSLMMIAGLQLFLSALVEEQKDSSLEQRRLASVLAQTSDLVAISDPNGRVQYLNNAGRELLGLSQDQDVSGVKIADVHPPDVYERIQREYIPAALRDGIWNGENTFWSRDGRVIPVLQVILAHKNGNGNIEFLSTIARDLTELKNAQSALHDSEKRFLQAQKMESIALLAGGIAHDFNNMLGVILGHAQLLSDESGMEASASQRVKCISDAALRAAALTRQLLAFSRRQVLQPRVVNLNSTVRDMANMLKHVLGANIHIQLRLDEPLGNVNIDPGQLEQIIMNLAVNARDAMPGGGTLVVQTKNRELDASSGTPGEDVQPGQYVMLAVSDTGIGMDAETQSRIFEPFFTTKPLGQGTGLGLATVYGITKQSGGQVWVYSEPGKGTTFGVYLPRVEDDVRRMVETHARDLRGHEAILLVEDETALRALITDILTREGYTVVAASPEDALNIAARHNLRVDLLLTDMVMPKISGQELAIKCLQARPDLKVLYMSGYAPEVLDQGEELQPSNFVQKPFTKRLLLEKLRLVLESAAVAAKG
jgi:PAS domain S-box-containing protein